MKYKLNGYTSCPNRELFDFYFDGETEIEAKHTAFRYLLSRKDLDQYLCIVLTEIVSGQCVFVLQRDTNFDVLPF